jgi:cell division cycle 20-like protein 1 (cofactor of APC complex)
MTWKDTCLATGGQDHVIIQRDMRTPRLIAQQWTSHTGEVCGLRWNKTYMQLASGANDNLVYIWDCRRVNALWRFSEHKAAVKAVSWSPFEEHLLCTGGGKDDFALHFWNTQHGTLLDTVETTAQVTLNRQYCPR